VLTAETNKQKYMFGSEFACTIVACCARARRHWEMVCQMDDQAASLLPRGIGERGLHASAPSRNREAGAPVLHIMHACIVAACIGANTKRHSRAKFWCRSRWRIQRAHKARCSLASAAGDRPLRSRTPQTDGPPPPVSAAVRARAGASRAPACMTLQCISTRTHTYIHGT
jgi:hypothetical protein